MRNKMIIVEGPDGSGKTTAVEYIMQMLEGKGIDAVSVRNPGDTVVGQMVRQLIKSPEAGRMCPATSLMLQCASTAQTMAEIVIPALEEGKWVVMDRFTWSTYIYQGVVMGNSIALIDALCNQFKDTPCESIVVYMDTPYEVIQERVMARGELDYWEANEERRRAVYDAYVDKAKREPHMTMKDFIEKFNELYG